MYTLLRETPFIKEWQTPFGTFIDSKYRWLALEPNAKQFLHAWRTASPPEKFDLEAAFQFYPYELEGDIEQILQTIAKEDQPRAQRMAKNIFNVNSQLTPDQQRFLAGLGEHLEAAAVPMRLVGQNKWFAAYANDAGFHIQSHLASPLDAPSDEELQSQIDATLSLAFRRLLQTVKENKYLLDPNPNEQPFPL